MKREREKEREKEREREKDERRTEKTWSYMQTCATSDLCLFPGSDYLKVRFVQKLFFTVYELGHPADKYCTPTRL